jgi:ribosomal protein S18 acetylase RimI-like enzyme
MEELLTLDDIDQASSGDAALLWAAQGRTDGSLGPGVRAWRHGQAVAVASPGLSRRHRIVLQGTGPDASALTRQALDVVGPSYQVFGDARTVDGVLRQLSELEPVLSFLWMETATPATRFRHSATARPRWLSRREEQDATGLFEHHFPDSHAQPGRDGVHRWAGVVGRPHPGSAPEPLAVAAEAWSGAGCGFMAGVVTHPSARGQGLALAVCGFVLDALTEQHGRCALLVHHGNPAAIATYERLGMAGRAFRSARLRANLQLAASGPHVRTALAGSSVQSSPFL